jgi:hypothetical protein
MLLFSVEEKGLKEQTAERCVILKTGVTGLRARSCPSVKLRTGLRAGASASIEGFRDGQLLFLG